MSETVFAVLFLAVSMISMTVQGVSCMRLLRAARAADHLDIHAGMVRTAVCRVAAAAVYTGFGLTALVAQETFPVLALAVFTFVQVLWQANALADVRLHRRLGGNTRPKLEERL